MPSTILLRSPGAIADKRIRLSNSQFCRPFNVGTWTRLRVAMRLSADFQTVNGTVTFMTGLCSGSTLLPGDVTCQHAVGLGTNQAWTLSGTEAAGNGAHYLAATLPMTKVGATLTVGGLSVYAANSIGATGPTSGVNIGKQRGLMFIDFTKAPPNMTINGYFRRGDFGAIAEDQSEAGFLAAAEIESGLALGNYSYGTGRSTAADEVTNGTLDHVFFWWPRTLPAIEISDLAVVKFA